MEPISATLEREMKTPKRNIVVVLIFAVIFIFLGRSCLKDSPYSNCVTTENNENYIGEKLLTDTNITKERILTTACIAKDELIDGGDGNNSGKVRWVVCLSGPDCDEAGNF